MTTAKIIVNPYSGRWKAKAAIPDIERSCQKIGLDYELAVTDTPNHGLELAQKAVEAAVSGALLRGLLYLGAFMIIVSAAILVVLFWDIFPEVLQLAFIAAVPTAFYLAGWGARAKLELPEVGGVLAGIGALLVAVDFAAVYQFGGLSARVDGNTYSAGASPRALAVWALVSALVIVPIGAALGPAWGQIRAAILTRDTVRGR